MREGNLVMVYILLDPRVDPCFEKKFAHLCNILSFRGVGSGVDFSANVDGSETTSEATRGKVFVRIGWAKTPDGIVLAPPPEQWSPPAASKRYYNGS